jgi:hypothetical protein
VNPRRPPRRLEFSATEDGTQRAAHFIMAIAVDPAFAPQDAFRATVWVSGEHPTAIEPERRTVWWPIVLVGFFAVVFATVAFLKSPLAKHPSVAPYANAALAKIG